MNNLIPKTQLEVSVDPSQNHNVPQAISNIYVFSHSWNCALFLFMGLERHFYQWRNQFKLDFYTDSIRKLQCLR